MKNLNFSNVEELIFSDKNAQSMLPPYMANYFEQWKLSKRVPMLNNMGRRAMIDFLNSLEDEHITALEEYFGEAIFVEKLNYNISWNMKIPLENAEEVCQEICKIEGRVYYSTWRDKEYLYITLWR